MRFGISSCEDPSFLPCLFLSHLLESPSHIPRHISRISPYISVFHLILSPTLSSPLYISLDILLYADFHFLAGVYLRKQQIFEFHLEDGAKANWLCFDFRCDDIAVQPTHYPICCFLLSTSGSRDFDSPLCDIFCLTGLSCFARYLAGFLHLSSSEFLARFVSNFHSLLVVPPFPSFSFLLIGSRPIVGGGVVVVEFLSALPSLTIAASQRATKSDI